jgi:THAP4-like, heme-binding beta-barrel domain
MPHPPCSPSIDVDDAMTGVTNDGLRSSAMDGPPLHPDLLMLGGLLGMWRGEGFGEYPTIAPFRYSEEVSFGHAGKPFLAYRQATTNLDNGSPAHAEAGYWRAAGGSRIELVLAHPSGIAELSAGDVEPTANGLRVALRSEQVARTASAKPVVRVDRMFELDGDVLRYTLDMAAVGQEHQRHLSAELHRWA